VAKKSHRLGYSVPKIATDQSAPSECKTTTVTLQHTPVECIKRGLPVEEALQMKPLELNKTDGLFLLKHGLSKQCIKRLYGFKSDATLYVRLKSLGLHPWPAEEQETSGPDVTPEAPWKPVASEVPEEVKAAVSDAMAKHANLPTETCEPESIPDEVITDPAKIAELMAEPVPPETPPEIFQGFTWFYGNAKPGTIAVLTVMGDGKISFPSAIRRQYFDLDTRMMIGFKANPDNLVVVKTNNPEIGLKPSMKQAKIKCVALAKELIKNGIELPAKYEMSWNEPEQLWTGVLLP